MNKRITKSEAISNARRDFKQFIIWLNVTHPRYTTGFIQNRTFNFVLMNNRLNFLKKWDSSDGNFKKLNAKEYADCSTAFNYGFGVDHDLKESVLGTYKDDSGKQHKVTLTDIGIDNNAKVFYIDELRITHINDGRKKDFKTNETKYTWSEKYLLDADIREEFLKNPEYSRHETYPDMSERLHRILSKWISKNKKKKPVSNNSDCNNEDVKETHAKPKVEKQKTDKQEANELTPLSIDDFIRCVYNGILSDAYIDVLMKGVYGANDITINKVRNIPKNNDFVPANRNSNEMWKRLWLKIKTLSPDKQQEFRWIKNKVNN